LRAVAVVLVLLYHTGALWHWRYVCSSAVKSVCLGALLIALSLGLVAFELHSHP
jgi:hypothetical protein